ncbi:MAG: NADPH:quinone oxidoreductase family protein [Sphingopyxis sp.]|nr:NADPH:quinone oxidoreductase family protein [Sphingopyxis sp.]
MQALTISALSGDYSGTAIARVPMPQPAAGQVLVQVRAAAVNFPDILMTQGAYQLKPPLPFTPGLEFSGEIASVGAGVDPMRVGQAVIGSERIGAMAEYIVAPVAALSPKPDSVDWSIAAAYRATYLTAYVSLVRRAQLRSAEWVLVHGAAGGVGTACVDLAKALGARVIAAGSDPDRLARVQALYGCDATVDVRGGFRHAVLDITGGQGADVIIDPVGGDVFDESLRCTAFDGRLLVVGFASGRIPAVAANYPLIKGFSVMGVRAGEYGRRFPERGVENIAAIDAMVADGALRPHIHAALPLNAWRTAFDMLTSRSVIGKVVLLP